MKFLAKDRIGKVIHACKIAGIIPDFIRLQHQRFRKSQFVEPFLIAADHFAQMLIGDIFHIIIILERVQQIGRDRGVKRMRCGLIHRNLPKHLHLRLQIKRYSRMTVSCQVQFLQFSKNPGLVQPGTLAHKIYSLRRHTERNAKELFFMDQDIKREPAGFCAVCKNLLRFRLPGDRHIFRTAFRCFLRTFKARQDILKAQAFDDLVGFLRVKIGNGQFLPVQIKRHINVDRCQLLGKFRQVKMFP